MKKEDIPSLLPGQPQSSGIFAVAQIANSRECLQKYTTEDWGQNCGRLDYYCHEDYLFELGYLSCNIDVANIDRSIA